MCDGGCEVWGAGRRHGVWSMGVAVWVAGMCGCGTVGKKKMGMTVWVAGMSVGKAWEKKLIF